MEAEALKVVQDEKIKTPYSLRKGKIRNKLLMSFLASGVVQLTTLPIVLWFYGEVSVMGIFLNLLVLPTVGIVLGSGTAGALLGLVTVRGAFLAVVPGRIILRGYEFLTVLLGRLSFCTWIGGKPEVKQHLENLGFVVGSVVSVITTRGGNVIVKVKESRVAISEEMARKIMV